MHLGLQTFQITIRSSFIRLDGREFTRWNLVEKGRGEMTKNSQAFDAGES